jgi:hypothetical protein
MRYFSHVIVIYLSFNVTEKIDAKIGAAFASVYPALVIGLNSSSRKKTTGNIDYLYMFAA